jgi:hypothetical protein
MLYLLRVPFSGVLARSSQREAISGRVLILSRADLSRCPRWASSFQTQRKDYRYYEIVEDTICPELSYRYFAIEDEKGEVLAVQPFFIVDQDLLLGASPRIGPVLSAIRRVWPRFMFLRTLMVGCAAGEGHPDDAGAASYKCAQLLAGALPRLARQQKAPLIVLKEFPSRYRGVLSCFLSRGFTRVPSMPMTRLDLNYLSFEDYMAKALKSSGRAKLRKKFRAAGQAAPIEMTAVGNVSDVIDSVYPLYLQVYHKAKLKFEKLTKEYFLEIGARMPDKARFFIWRQNGKIVAFAFCMAEGDSLFGEYIGLDYPLAMDLHLYHYAMRDILRWAIANGFKSFVSSGLNYTPKLQMRHVLAPLDLYVRHTSPIINFILKRAIPFLEPTRQDKTLNMFPNYNELWGG